jgi:hypothetical protein
LAFGQGNERGINLTTKTMKTTTKSLPHFKTFRIGSKWGWQEECPCANCGQPLFEGDKAIEIDGREGYSFCSKVCATTYQFSQ